MGKIELKKLTLSNWRGQNVKITFNEECTTIKGQNGEGKTSIMSAWFWLLSSYTDTILPKNSSLFDDTKPLSKDTPHAIVEAELVIDGSEWKIKREAIASFKLNKGTGEWEKQPSDKYIYSIDDIEMSATDFNKWIEANICGIDLLTYCLNGSFFGVLSMEDKKLARKILEGISGEIKSEDFKGDYSLLDSWFKKGYTTDEISTSVKAKQKNINKRLTEIPALIDGKEEFIAQLARENFDDIEKQRDECKREIEEIDKMLAVKSASEEKVRQEREAIQYKIDELLYKKRKFVSEDEHKYEDELSNLEIELNETVRENAIKRKRNQEKLDSFNAQKETLKKKKEYLAALKEERERLLKERDEIKEMVFTDDICPVCHRELPPIELEETKEKFNQSKADKLTSIVTQGKMNALALKETEKEVKRIGSMTLEDLGLEEIVDAEPIRKQIQDYKSSYVPFLRSDECKAINDEMEKLEESKPSYKTDNSELVAKKSELMNNLEALNIKLGGKRLMEEAIKDVEELKKERVEIGIEYTKLEGLIQKCNEYNEERAQIVSDKVNEHLTTCKIQMWERQKNGELIPSCSVVSNDGVRLTTINHSQRVLIEAELQKLFCIKSGIQMPIFFDEASIFDSKHTPKSEGWQIVLLKASDDPYLIVE